MTSKESGPNTADAEPAGNVDNPRRRRRGGRKEIPAHVGVKNNKPSPDTLPRAEREPSGGEGSAQIHEHTEQEIKPEVDGDLGVSHDINHEQTNDNNLPALIDTGNATLPASYEQAKQALALCKSIVKCKEWEDKMAALAAYARMAGDTELENDARRIKALAKRRAGELLHEIPGETGGRPPQMKNSGGHPPESHPNERMSARTAAARAAGMSPHQAKEAMRVAAVPKEEFDRQVNGSKPPTIATLAKQGTRRRPLPAAPPADARRAKADSHKNNTIGVEAVARARERLRTEVDPAELNQIAANTPEWEAFVTAIERLPPEVATLGRKLMSCVEQEVRNTEQAAGRTQELDDE